MSAQDESPNFLTTDSVQDAPLIVEVPSTLPILHRRYRSGLDQPYRGVGLEGNRYDAEPTGAVWQAWTVLGIGIAFAGLAAVVGLLGGEWLLVLLLSPLAGLMLAAMVRSLRAEQKAKRAKQLRLAKRLRAMKD